MTVRVVYSLCLVAFVLAGPRRDVTQHHAGPRRDINQHHAGPRRDIIHHLAGTRYDVTGDGNDVASFFTSNTAEMVDAPLSFSSPPPAWLQGTLIRNGLGRFEVGDRRFTNALDAYAKLASWTFLGNGSASFTTRMVETASYRESVRIGDIAPYMVLDKTEPAFTVMQDMQCMKNGLDNPNVNVYNFGGASSSDLVVLSDYWKVYTVDPASLKTLGSANPHIPDAPFEMYPVSLSSAHPLPESGTSNYLTFASLAAIMPNMKSKMVLARATSASEREIITTIEVDKISYMHSFAATDNYMILFATPFYVDIMGVLRDFKPLSAFEWRKEDVTHIYVVNLKTKEVQVLQTENMFFLHIVNSYESDLFKNEIIVDICTYQNTSSMYQFEFEHLNDPVQRAKAAVASLKRYTLNLDTKAVSIHEFQKTSNIDYVNRLDFPTINEHYRYKKYCYAYGVVNSYDSQDFLHTALVKKDLCTGSNEYSWVSPGRLVNEAYFVARPGGREEDDGVLVTPVSDSATNTTTINVFDARDLTLISSAALPTNVPFGTHGRFFDFIH